MLTTGPMKLTLETWTHYLYIIYFVDGCFYTGVSKRKKDDPLNDGYYGSPTDKSKWEQVAHEKEIVAYLWCHDMKDAYDMETKWQKKNFELNGHFCLNKHFGSTNFTTESSRKGGETQGKLNVQLNKGLWKEDVLRMRSEIGRRGGLKGGKAAVESGQLAVARDKAYLATRRAVVLTQISTGEQTKYPSLHAAARAISGEASALCMVAKGFRSSHKGFKVEYLQG